MGDAWKYREYPPPPHLAGRVDAFWSERAGARPDDPGARVLPDGCIDLVWFPGRAPVVAGPATLPVMTRAEPGQLIVGVRFRTGLAASVLGVPATELRDATVPLADLWGRWPDRRLGPVEKGETSASERERLAALHALILDRLATARPDDSIVLEAIRWLVRRPTGQLDGSLYSQIGLGERQLRRRFEAAVGYGPKTFQRIVRFRHWLNLARGADGDGLRLADLAAEAGYADQPHLTREVSRLAGVPPSMLLAR
jgi:AraC-like DNA-binding protein